MKQETITWYKPSEKEPPKDGLFIGIAAHRNNVCVLQYVGLNVWGRYNMGDYDLVEVNYIYHLESFEYDVHLSSDLKKWAEMPNYEG